MAPKSRENVSIIGPKTDAENHPKMKPNRCKLEPKLSHKAINRSKFFWLGFRMPLETLIFPRRAAGVAAGVTLSPADPPGRRHLSKNIVQ